MRKGWIGFLTAILVVALAAPAMADLKVTGFYQTKAMVSNFFDGAGGPSLRTDDEEQSNSYNEQRARIKFDVGTENARAVFFFESDINWGVGPTGAERNSGGQLSGDSVQLETKNVYVWFKIPDTSITATVGLQAFNDSYAGIFSNAADMTGIFVNGTFEPVKYTLGWAKLYEGTQDGLGGGSGGYDAADDASMYAASIQFAPGKDMTLGVNFYYLQDDTGRSFSGALVPQAGLGGDPLDFRTVDVYMPGVNFAMNAGIAKLSGFAFYQFGTLNSTIGGEDIDVNAFMVDLRADLKLGPGNLFVEGFYISGGDGTDPTEYESPITLGDYQRAGYGTGGNAGFGRTNMYFLFGADSLNVSQCIIGCSGGELGDSFGNSGRGLWHVAAGYSQSFTEKLKGAINVGTVYAVDTYDGVDDDTTVIRQARDKDIATEFNARVDYTISKGLNFSLVGAYMLLGDFVQNDAGTDEFNDAYYMGYAKLAYSF